MQNNKKASLGQIHRFSWVSLLVCWLIWILNAYDREIVLRLGPTISKHFDLSADQWGTLATVVMLALAVLDIPGSIWSDRYGGGWKRARFQVPLVLGYTALSFLSGFKALSASLASFVALRVGVNLGAGLGRAGRRQQHRRVVACGTPRFRLGRSPYRLSHRRDAQWHCRQLCDHHIW